MVDYLQISGDTIQTGEHGDTDYMFASGEPVPNTGQSNYVFESGVGIGGLSWATYINWPNGEITIGNNPRLELSHDGSYTSNGGKFGSALNEKGVEYQNFRVEFRDVTYSLGFAGDNWSLGVATSEQARPFNNNDGYHIRYYVHEDESGNFNRVDSFTVAAGGSSVYRNDSLSAVDWSTSHDIAIEYDGEARLYIDGTLKDSTTQAQDANYKVGMELEDDGSSSASETGTVGSVRVTDL